MLEPYFPTRELEDKVKRKHELDLLELREVFKKHPRIFLRTKRDRYGDRVYRALGRTASGRYITVYFVREPDNRARVITARDMQEDEKKRYRRK